MIDLLTHTPTRSGAALGMPGPGPCSGVVVKIKINKLAPTEIVTGGGVADIFFHLNSNTRQHRTQESFAGTHVVSPEPCFYLFFLLKLLIFPYF